MISNIPKLYSLPPDQLEMVRQDLRELGPSQTAKKYFEKLSWKEANLYQALLKEAKKLGYTSPNEPTRVQKDAGESYSHDGLTDTELELIQNFKDGKVGFDEMHREIAVKAFEKILRDPSSIKVRDWLTTELVKIKKDETSKRSDAMEAFVDMLFSGFLPSPICPHCGKSVQVRKEVLGNVRPLQDEQ